MKIVLMTKVSATFVPKYLQISQAFTYFFALVKWMPDLMLIR